MVSADAIETLDCLGAACARGDSGGAQQGFVEAWREPYDDYRPARVAQPLAQRFDVEKHELVVNEQRVPLRPLEFSVLRYVSAHAGNVVHSLHKKREPHAALIEMMTKVGYSYRRS